VNPAQRAVAARAASLLLRYPDAEVLGALPVVRAALAELPAAVADPLWTVADHRTDVDPVTLAAEYVELFDFRRRCCLYLTYYTCGDTRKRGEALVGFTAAYRAAGFRVADGELPDYLPAVLDLAAVHESGAAHRSVYRRGAEAVRTLLPPPRAADLTVAARLVREGPPREEVGLEPFTLRGTR
jgi:nitrate reductase delta subunit